MRLTPMQADGGPPTAVGSLCEYSGGELRFDGGAVEGGGVGVCKVEQSTLVARRPTTLHCALVVRFAAQAQDIFYRRPFSSLETRASRQGS